jgi:TetR/AcrR family transcriptional regulator, transcriptional repressor for nem operon
MPPRRSFDDATVARAARDVFWMQGYSHTSVADLERATGLPRSTIRAAYGGKRKLYERAIEDYLENIAYPMLAPLEAHGSGGVEIAGYFRRLARNIRQFADCNQTPGCMILNTVTELFVLDDEAGDVVREYRRRTKAAFRHALDSVAAVPDPDAQADLLVIAQIGVLVSSKIDPEGAARQAELQARQIDSW